MERMISRRTALLAGTSTLALSACSLSGGGGLPSVVVAGFQAIAQEVQLALPQLQAAGLSGTAANTVTTIIGGVQAAARVVSAVSTPTQGSSTLTTIESYVNEIAPLVAPFVSLVPGGGIIALVIAALPELEAALNFTVSLLSAQAKQIAAAATPASAVPGRVGLTPLQRLIAQAEK